MLITTIGIMASASCKKESDSSPNPSGTNDPVVTALTEEEKNDLLFMREEEKLARDVYLYASNLYGQNIFNNISSSEQRHMDEILTLLEKYDIADPASPDAGAFNNAGLQDLYDSLTNKCDQSILEAYIVGATIEDLDIRDLEDCMNRTTKPDLLDVFGKLQCASRNHMRSFYSKLEGEGGSYEAQFITPQELTDILNGSHEKCGMQ